MERRKMDLREKGATKKKSYVQETSFRGREQESSEIKQKST